MPSVGESSAKAFVVVKNPTMYDVYVVSASSEVAGEVELRRTEDGESAAVREMTVPAYGSVSMGPDGLHLLLKDLKRPLKAGESVPLSLKTDGALTLEARAVVREE